MSDPHPLSWLVGYLWQVALHSFLAGLALYAWSRHRSLAPGRPKRVLLAVLLVLPLVTAAVPGRATAAFRDEVAWFDSSRLLALPLAGDLRFAHLVAAAGVVALVVTFVQEVMPALGRPRRGARPAPAELVARVRALPGWESADVELIGGDRPIGGGDPGAAVAGPPWRPRLLLSAELLERLDEGALAAVLRHEHAHHRPRSWWAVHALYAARLVQCVNPVALWLFREYLVEVEIDCDRQAAAGGGERPLARALLALYERTDRGDLAARATLRLRVDLLLGRRPAAGFEPGPRTLAAASALLAVLLPWVV